MEKVWIGKIDVRRQSILLRKYKPDIIFLQEIDMYTKRAYHKNQLYTFSKYTGLNFRAMGTNMEFFLNFQLNILLTIFLHLPMHCMNKEVFCVIKYPLEIPK